MSVLGELTALRGQVLVAGSTTNILGVKHALWDLGVLDQNLRSNSLIFSESLLQLQTSYVMKEKTNGF